jgi:ketosteroid isomerase-like protein/acyl-coenzyme A thioesterase PaaI-like protein
MGSAIEVVRRFYQSIQAMDVEGLLGTLAAEDFVGEVTAGLPVVGGVHRGAYEMLRRAWIPAHEHYRAMPIAEEILDLGGGRVLGLGHYEGCPPETGASFVASFAHVVAVADDKIVHLRQITDSATWAAALRTDGRHPGSVGHLEGPLHMSEPTAVVDAILEDLIPLAGTLGVRQLQASPDRVVLELPAGGLASNHVGTVYAGASYTLAELTAGALAALAGAPLMIPVLVAGEIQHVAPAMSAIRSTAARDNHLDDLPRRWQQDRRLVSTLLAECSSEQTVVARATFTYRWLGPG